ncbi:hypothetical protein [Metasolibacillus fluoroglycofenilyticus]|uniref:hypothetical protein n=1 Tax=Metasolibacillus fluoroglycofenilyticus TaxID=1239396 RepID=UPI000D3CA9B9|nr:hypothetical protein [Metasolibacillus fluoroglycofenilyticus]
MVQKQGKYYRFSEKTLQQLEELKHRDGGSYTSILESAVEQLYLKTYTQNEMLLGEIERLLDVKMSELLMPDLKRLIVIGNVLDRNIQMQMEFWNHEFVMSAAKGLGSTDKHLSAPFREAQELIKQRIAHNRQKKLDKEAKRVSSSNQSN